MKALLENKKEIILSNFGYREYKNKKDALIFAKKIREKYNISVYPRRITKIKTQAKKNIIKTLYVDMYVLC